MIPLDSDLMRAFLAVVDTGSVTAAADRVGRTQSAVSMQIRKLEESLGQPLFTRLPRGVALTPRGAQLLPYARRVTSLLDEAATALREKPLAGPVRIGIPDEYAETILPRALAAFSERHPGVEVTVRCDFTAPQQAALDDDQLDLAVIYDSSHTSGDEVLCVDPTVWVTSIAHAQHLQQPVPVGVYFRSDWCRDFALRSLDQQSIPWRAAFECDTSASLRVAARTGLAISPLSRSTIPLGCRELTNADGFPIVDRARVVLKRNPRGGSAAIEGLAEMLREAFRPLATGGVLA
ncbi:LysR family transcriptional regulator [Cypionkella aquatica]|uniref:LysR family transcriptional regulator n=1 Tax=Cypionkella aquatica TaxID=1756042 RepID=A0AA37TVW2_9RHOB|nr:LysR substrate-binding domain-containing protein [Cypionkella aquatica]GLS85647.1 LysR family transcriptional regulator [Cypionkella aquatica]